MVQIIQNIMVGGLLLTAVIICISAFVGGIYSFSGTDVPNIGGLNETEEIFLQTEEIRSSTINVTAEESTNFDRAASFIGGTFQTMKLPWKAEKIFRGLITSMATELNIPLISQLSNIFMLIIGIVLTIATLKFVRGFAG